MTNATPLLPEEFTTGAGHRLAHAEMGRGDSIVLPHGNPTSSYHGATRCRRWRAWAAWSRPA